MMNKKTASIDQFSNVADGVKSASQICNTDYHPLRWLIPNILPLEGVAMVVAPPKAGKSLFVLNICLSCTMPYSPLGYYPAQPTIPILYLDLENTERRADERMKRIIGDRPYPPNLKIATDWPRLDKGGYGRLVDYLSYTPTAAVVIDTLGKVQTERNISNTHSYSLDQREIDKFKTLAKDFSIAIILIHHTRKSKSDDWVDMVSGSHGISGTVDTLLYLYRARGQTGAMLYVTGRDMDEDSYCLRFKAKTNTWVMVGRMVDQNQYMSQAKQDVITVLDFHDSLLTPMEIANQLGKSVNSVKKILANLLISGHAVRESHGQYCGRIP